MDLILEKGKQLIAVEIKASTSPKPGKGFWNAIEFLKPNKTFVIALIKDPFPGPKRITITNLEHFLESL